MSKQITETKEDVYGVYKQNVEKYFESVEKTMPQYFQLLSSMHEECLHGCKNVINSAISLRQEFAKKSGTHTDISETAKNSLVDINKQLIRVNSTHSQIMQTTNDTIKQNMKTWNENASAFTDLNRNIMNTWLSAFTQEKS
ncbi:MAG: hypothetical protein K8Q89_06235 [Nitrosarchaeum sp.]|nr:hypothetical protein [Nitrosarchaeum sp.]